MSEDFSPNGLRDEWTLLLHSFLEEDSVRNELLTQFKADKLSADQLKSVKKEFSNKRKKLNQAIEKIKIKIEQVSGVIENLELVGSDISGLVKEIDYLSYEGEKISEEIFSLDKKIKKLHDLQEIVTASA